VAKDLAAITVRVLYFGQAREASGASEESITLRAPASLAELVEQAKSKHERLAKLDKTMRIAVNSEFTGFGHPLANGDEVAFLPAVAGG
jgi:molybdopterin converting factor subunit 1